MKTLKFIFVSLLTLFSVNSFSQTTHTFNVILDNVIDSRDVHVGDTIRFMNGFEDGDFYKKVNGSQSGTDVYKNFGDMIWEYVVPNTSANFVLKVGRVGNTLSTTEVTISISTAGISENMVNYSVYPNPTTDFLNIDGVDVNSVKVFDMNGQLVVNDNTNKIDVSGLSNGYYTLVVNETSSVRFIKK